MKKELKFRKSEISNVSINLIPVPGPVYFKELYFVGKYSIIITLLYESSNGMLRYYIR
jgi:hypothetical protein